MRYSQSRKVAVRRVSPRKQPTQARSAQTVEAIVEGAAHILERHGLEGYTTNAIAARAGVSIGSFYQYFPTKDAVTIALIERESVSVVADVKAALMLPDPRQTLRGMIKAAVHHQLRRPALSKLLDFEQSRLSQILPVSGNAQALFATVVGFLTTELELDDPVEAAVDIMSITRALTDAAGRRPIAHGSEVARRIEGTLLGYLSIVANPATLRLLNLQRFLKTEDRMLAAKLVADNAHK